MDEAPPPAWLVGELIEALADSTSDLGALVAVATGADARSAWKWLARHGSWPARRAMAANPTAPAIALRTLYANSGSEQEVQAMLAANPSCPPHVLARISGTWDPEVRAIVAANPSCPTRVLGRLRRDRYQVVRLAAQR